MSKLKLPEIITKKQYVCDRCGRNDFINGHALGGHKKYCSKPEYKTKNKKRRSKNPDSLKIKLKVSKKKRSIKQEPISTDFNTDINSKNFISGVKDFLFYNHSILSLCLKDIGDCDCPNCKNCDFSEIFTDENDKRILQEMNNL